MVTRTDVGGSIRVQVGRRVDSATRLLVQSYSTAWQRTRDQLAAAAADAEAQALARGMADVPAAYRTARLQASLDVLTEQLTGLAGVAGVTVARTAGPVAKVPAVVLHQFGRQQGVNLNLPADRALQQVVRRTTQRIASSRPQLSAQAEAEVRNALVDAVAGGQGPRTAARAMLSATRSAKVAELGLTGDQLRALERGGRAEAIVAEVRGAFAGGLSRSLNLARTELIDVSRQATTMSYLANPGLVRGWRWVAHLGERTCPACWALHNTVHKPEEHQEGHQQCRCTQVPILATDQPGDDDVGDPLEALRRLPRDKQRQVMGSKRLALLDEGLPLGELAHVRDNPGWRQGFYVKPLRDLPEPGSPLPFTPAAPPPATSPVPISAPELAPAAYDAPAALEGLDVGALEDDVLEALIADPRLYDDDALATRVMAELDARDAVTNAAAGRATDPQVTAAVDAWAADQARADARLILDGYDPAEFRARLAPKPKTHAQKVAELRADYDLWVHNQWLTAEEATRGGLLSKEAAARGIDVRELFSGPHARAWKWASEELKLWWYDNPRMTFTEWKHASGYGGRSGAAAARKAREIRAGMSPL